MAEFCKLFNERTKNLEQGTPLPVELSAFSNRTFEFHTKSPPTSWFVKRCVGVSAGAKRYVVFSVFLQSVSFLGSSYKLHIHYNTCTDVFMTLSSYSHLPSTLFCKKIDLGTKL